MTQDKSFRNTFLFILGIFCASFVLSSILYPDLWFYHTRRLLICHDILIPFESTFILVSHFFHGGIQLWDRFDQMNNAYFILSNGVYSVSNIITAVSYVLFSPFFIHPGEALYHMHLVLFYSLTSLIRIIGGYVLLRKFVSNKAVLFVSILFLNTILTSYMMSPGILPQGVYSFFPLLLYFIICFFEEFNFRSLLLAALVMALCVGSSPLLALGYFYQAVHFFVLCCLISFLFQRGWRKSVGRPSMPKIEIIKNAGLLGCCFLIVLPYFWWGHALTHDFYVHGSGLGETRGRFNNILNLSGYFNMQGKSFAYPFEFLGTSLDYLHNVWGESWLFIGGSALFLALTGIVLSKDRRKYIFAGTIFCVLLINTPVRALGGHFNGWIERLWIIMSSIIHTVNAITNPFCFLVRSFHMTSLLIPMLLLPLMAMGLESCLRLWQGRAEIIHFNRRWLLVIFYGIVILWALTGGTQALSVYSIGQGAAQTLREYILCGGVIFFLLILIPMLVMDHRLCPPGFFLSGRLWIVWIILGVSFIVDFAALTAYVPRYRTIYADSVAPTRISPSYTHQAVVPDYQNPQLLPVREFFNADRTFISPPIYAPQGMYGALYQYTPMGRFFNPWSLYEPRPLIYKELYPDMEIRQYLSENLQNIFFADYAFDSRYLGLNDILRLNLGRRVITVDREEFNKTFLKSMDRVYISAQDVEKKFYKISLDWTKAKVDKRPAGWEYTFDLPKDFPFYLSTTVFTNDYSSWKLTVANRILDPIQGELTAPDTYDVQNVHIGKITVLLAGQRDPLASIDLQVKLPERISGIWRNTYDDLGLTYEAPKEGWLVFNFPYDKMWELSIDGRKTPISIVNKCFIGAPILGGEHQVLLRYWPHTSLRFWIFMSMLLSVICFFGLMFYCIKREALYRV